MKIITITSPKLIKTLSCLLCLISCVSFVNAQTITPALNLAQAEALVGNFLIGTGVSFGNVTYSGQFVPTLLGGYPGYQIGSFYGFGAPNTNLGINSGIIMSNGSVSRANSPNIYKGYGNFSNSDADYYEYFCQCEAKNMDLTCVKNLDHCQWNDPDLEAILGCTGCTYNAVSLQFDFMPFASYIRFMYVFASDETPDFVCCSTNDIFAFLVSGPNPFGGNYVKQNIALVPGTNEYVSINTINGGVCAPEANCTGNIASSYDLTNSQFYVNNLNGKTIVYNGFTRVLKASINVIPCQTYHMKIALADVSDDAYDSSLFIEAANFSIHPPIPDITYWNPTPDTTSAIKGCGYAKFTFNTYNRQGVQADSSIKISFGGTAVNGTDYITIPAGIDSSITIPKGDSTYSFLINPLCTQPGKDLYVLFSVFTCGLAATDTIWIKDVPPITATPSPGDTICPGQSATISVTNVQGGVGAPYRYSWSSNPTGFTSEVANPTVSPIVSTTYTVTIKDSCKTCNVDTINIIVKVTASIKENSQNLLIFSVIPNPFNNNTIFSFRLPETGFVSIKVYDLLGNEIKTLVNKTMNKGVNKVEFEASGMESGMYYYRLNAGKQTASGKLILIN